MKTMRLPVEVRRDLEVMARRGYPEETCGLLIGKRSESLVVVYQALEARNLKFSVADKLISALGR